MATVRTLEMRRTQEPFSVVSGNAPCGIKVSVGLV